MARVLSVYLNDHDEKMLSDLCNLLGLTEESTAMKVALKHVANDHSNQKLSEKPVASEPKVDSSLLDQVKELLRECVKEIKEEQSPKTEAVVDLETGKLERKSRIL